MFLQKNSVSVNFEHTNLLVPSPPLIHAYMYCSCYGSCGLLVRSNLAVLSLLIHVCYLSRACGYTICNATLDFHQVVHRVILFGDGSKMINLTPFSTPQVIFVINSMFHGCRGTLCCFLFYTMYICYPMYLQFINIVSLFHHEIDMAIAYGKAVHHLSNLSNNITLLSF